jgi:uncharacterized protein YdhG (YjbR/CyaY superfamily)
LTCERESIGGVHAQEVIDYIAAIAPQHRDLFDRVHRLILEACPDAEVVLAYKMPTYRIGKRRLNVATWSHGVSIYGWKTHGDGGLTRRHPELQTSPGTIQLQTDHAHEIPDQEIRDLARAALTS